ncbi:MAG: hypothetical protein U9N35_08640, partial [Euryarchaeota archaeon]|nr:hypothetical protein [Euryarchaeota archaeon]
MENKKIGMIGILAVVLIAIGTAAFLNTERESNTTDEEGPTILTVEYNGNEKDFTMGELMDMEKTSIKTDDPHLGEEIEYIGVSLQTFRKELN